MFGSRQLIKTQWNTARSKLKDQTIENLKRELDDQFYRHKEQMDAMQQKLDAAQELIIKCFIIFKIILSIK